MDEHIKSMLPYDVSRGGQVVEKLDLTYINSNRKNKLHAYAVAKMDDLRNQYEQTMALWQWNEYVDSFDINFEPIVGKTYYLYQGITKFVSILSPTEFKRPCLGTTQLSHDGYWVKL